MEDDDDIDCDEKPNHDQEQLILDAEIIEEMAEDFYRIRQVLCLGNVAESKSIAEKWDRYRASSTSPAPAAAPATPATATAQVGHPESGGGAGGSRR